MTCAERRPEIVAYVDEALGAPERAALEAHLAGCAECRAALEAERQLSGLLATLPRVEPGGDFEARFWARLARDADPPPRGLARLFSRRLALAFGGAAAAALAVVFALRGAREPDTDWQIVANTEDYELLEDPDLDVIDVVDVLEEWDRDPG